MKKRTFIIGFNIFYFGSWDLKLSAAASSHEFYYHSKTTLPPCHHDCVCVCLSVLTLWSHSWSIVFHICPHNVRMKIQPWIITNTLFCRVVPSVRLIDSVTFVSTGIFYFFAFLICTFKKIFLLSLFSFCGISNRQNEKLLWILKKVGRVSCHQTPSDFFLFFFFCNETKQKESWRTVFLPLKKDAWWWSSLWRHFQITVCSVNKPQISSMNRIFPHISF